MWTIHSIRQVASLALLGAILVGALTGWFDQGASFDWRVIGAVLGAIGGIVATATHAIA